MRPTTLPIPAPAPLPRPRRRPLADDPISESVRLIEFAWQTRAGWQPVLYLVRTYLH
jgi:hypothetical protein